MDELPRGQVILLQSGVTHIVMWDDLTAKLTHARIRLVLELSSVQVQMCVHEKVLFLDN